MHEVSLFPTALMLLACHVVGPGADSGETPPVTDSGTTETSPLQAAVSLDHSTLPTMLPGPGGCVGDTGVAQPLDGLDLAAEQSPLMPTVLHVTWSNHPGAVRYHDGQIERVAAGVPSETGHQAWLIGPTDGAWVTWSFEASDGQGCTDQEITQVGELLVPPVKGTVEVDGTGTVADGLILMSWFGDPGQENDLRSGAALLSRDGEAAWSASALEGMRIAAAEWTPTGLWTLQELEVGTEGDNLAVFLGADGEVGTVLTAPDSHHDLVVLDDHSLLWLEIDVREVDIGPVIGDPVGVVGDRVMRVQLDGSSEEVFSSWDHFELDPEGSRTWTSGYYGPLLDWSHANGLDLKDDGSSVLISLLGLSTVVELDLDSGEVLWTVDGLELEDADTRFGSLHSPIWSGTDKVKVFVNESNLGGLASYVAEFDVSLDPPREVWNSGRETSVHYSQALGKVAQAGADHSLVNYGMESVAEELDTDGAFLWRWSLSSEWVLGETDLVTLYED